MIFPMLHVRELKQRGGEKLLKITELVNKDLGSPAAKDSISSPCDEAPLWELGRENVRAGL